MGRRVLSSDKVGKLGGSWRVLTQEVKCLIIEEA